MVTRGCLVTPAVKLFSTCPFFRPGFWIRTTYPLNSESDGRVRQSVSDSGHRLSFVVVVGKLVLFVVHTTHERSLASAWWVNRRIIKINKIKYL